MMKLEKAPDVMQIVSVILARNLFPHIKKKQIVCMRSIGATSRARARIWAFPRIWQLALGMEPYYVIEVLSHYFDNMSDDDKIRVMIHELMHIPKNFSGALVPHRGKYFKINSRTVEKLFQEYRKQGI